MNKIYTIVILLLYSGPIFANIAQPPWKLWKKNSYQSVSFRPASIAGKPLYDQAGTALIEIKATAVVHSTVAGFLLFIQDVDNMSNWLINASESQVIQHDSPNENSFYIKLTHIWPLQPRALLLHSKYWQNDDLSVEINVTDANPDIVEKAKSLAMIDLNDYLRVRIYSAHWQLTPTLKISKAKQEDSVKLLIEYNFIADGRGDTPKWLADHLALKSIWKTMRNIRRQLPSSKWQAHSIKGITELSAIP